MNERKFSRVTQDYSQDWYVLCRVRARNRTPAVVVLCWGRAVAACHFPDACAKHERITYGEKIAMSWMTPGTGSVPVEPRQRFCTECGSDAGQGRFCASCGTQLASAFAAAPPMSGTAALSSAQREPFAAALAAPTSDRAPSAEFVQVAAVAHQTTEYVEVANLGVVKLASIGQRVLARVLDIALVVIADFIVVGIFSAVGASMARSSASSYSYGSAPYGSYGNGAGEAMAGAAGGGVGLVAGLFFMAIIAYFYELIMVTFWGRTLGKMLVGARIIRAGDGMKPNLGNAFLRWLAPGLGGLIPFLGPLGEALVLLSPTFDSTGRRQGWHDKMAGTLVVEAPRIIRAETITKVRDSARSATSAVRDSQARSGENSPPPAS